ncbi:hypothetical protein LP7551_04148 [Roseibium album]|nr:hypothetical protein LP7551_04148 [Roseibium album]
MIATSFSTSFTFKPPIAEAIKRQRPYASMMAVAARTNQIIFAVDALRDELSAKGFPQLTELQGVHTIQTGLALRDSLLDFQPIQHFISLTEGAVRRIVER